MSKRTQTKKVVKILLLIIALVFMYVEDYYTASIAFISVILYNEQF